MVDARGKEVAIWLEELGREARLRAVRNEKSDTKTKNPNAYVIRIVGVYTG